MHLDVSLQLAQLAASILTGFGLGLTYDALRALRRELCRNAALDTLFCAVLLLTLFTLGMDIGTGGSSHIHVLRSGGGLCGIYGAPEPCDTARFCPLDRLYGPNFRSGEEIFKKNLPMPSKNAFQKPLTGIQ